MEGTGRTSAGECHGGCDDCWLSPEACRRIREHTWPGNIRELRNAAERAVLIAREEKILPEHLQADLANGDGSGAAGGEGRPLTLSQMERRQISHVLKMTGGHKGEAADLLGIHRNTLRSKMQEYGLT